MKVFDLYLIHAFFDKSTQNDFSCLKYFGTL